MCLFCKYILRDGGEQEGGEGCRYEVDLGGCERRGCEMGGMTTCLVVGEDVEAADDFDVVRGGRVVQQDELGRDRVSGSLDGRAQE